MKWKTIKRQQIGYYILASAIFSLAIWLALAAASYSAPKIGQPPLLLSNQQRDNLTLSYAQAINRAKHSVLLFIYSLRDRTIIQTLRQKASEGAAVNVICDEKASRGVQHKLGSQVKTRFEKSKGLMHLKILLIDQQEIWIGSANMTSESLRHFGNLVVALKDPAIGAWILRKKEGPLPFRQFPLQGQQFGLSFLPDDKEAAKRVIRLIENAKKTIRIAMFTWTRPDFATAVINAAKRGVNVQIVVDRQSAHGASVQIVKQLRQAHIPIGLSLGSALLHYKFLYIDQKILLSGSANWTYSAFTKNSDCFTTLQPLTDGQQRTMDQLWNVIWSESM